MTTLPTTAFGLGPLPGTDLAQAADVVLSESLLPHIPQLPDRGAGFDLVGLRTWEPGDRLSAVDWPQSSLTNFSPLVVRDFEQPGTATVPRGGGRRPRCAASDGVGRPSSQRSLPRS